MRKNTLKKNDRDLKEEAVFLITALSLTGFFAHYVGITVLSIWLNQIPFKRVYHLLIGKIYFNKIKILPVSRSRTEKSANRTDEKCANTLKNEIRKQFHVVSSLEPQLS